MDCPACPAPTPLEEKRAASGPAVDLCPGCGGAWMDPGELEAYGSRAPGFAEEVERSLKTLLPAPRPCPRCARAMERGWLDGAEAEYRRCPACRGLWLDLDGLRRLRAHLADKAAWAAAAAAAAQPSPPPMITRRRGAVLAGAAALLLAVPLWRVATRPRSRPAPAPEPARTARDHERDALARMARGAAAESRGRLEEAREEYEAAAQFYHAALLSARPPESWRLELEYAKAGEPLARVFGRLGRPDEARAVHRVRAALFERYGLKEELARARESLRALEPPGT